MKEHYFSLTGQINDRKTQKTIYTSLIYFLMLSEIALLPFAIRGNEMDDFFRGIILLISMIAFVLVVYVLKFQ